MITGIESILLSSHNANALAAFYRDTVGLKMTNEMEMGDKGDKVYEFALASGSTFFIMDHSDITGPAVDPKRFIINFEVDDMEAEKANLDGKNVKKVQDTYHVEGYGLITTYEDVDGNYFQLVQVKES